MWNELYEYLKEWSSTKLSKIAKHEHPYEIFWPVYTVFYTSKNEPFDIDKFPGPSEDVCTIIDHFMKTQMIDSNKSATIKCDDVIQQIKTRIIEDFVPKFKNFLHKKFGNFGFLTPIIQFGIASPDIRNLYTQLSVLELWNRSTEHGTKLLALNAKLKKIIDPCLGTSPQLPTDLLKDLRRLRPGTPGQIGDSQLAVEDKKIVQSKQYESYTFEEYCRLIEQVYNCKEVSKNSKEKNTWLDYGVNPDDFDYFRFGFATDGKLFFVYGLMSERTAMLPFSSFKDEQVLKHGLMSERTAMVPFSSFNDNQVLEHEPTYKGGTEKRQKAQKVRHGIHRKNRGPDRK